MSDNDVVKKMFLDFQIEYYNLIVRYLKAKYYKLNWITKEDIYTRTFHSQKEKIHEILIRREESSPIGNAYTIYKIPVESVTEEIISKMEKDTDLERKLQAFIAKSEAEISELIKENSILKKQLNPKKNIVTKGIHISPRDFKEEIDDENN
jgi:hypothetical protein